MTEKDVNLPTTPPEEMADVEPTPEEVTVQSEPPAAKPKTKKRGRRKAAEPSGPSAAEADDGRQALLQVNSYEEAVVLLSTKPELIEQARLIFGRVVPTTGQNDLVDLAIRAAAEDDDLTLRQALAAKRERHLALTHPEITQLLEFAHTALAKAPVLTLNVALLLTDDLARLENGDLWQQQREVILAAEQALMLDATDLWEQISAAASEPEPEPEVAPPPEPAVEAPQPEEPAGAVTSGPVPVTTLPRRRMRQQRAPAMPGWLAAIVFFTLLLTMTCCLCAMGAFAGY